MSEKIEQGSKLERLLRREFSGDTEKMFNALQGQLKKSAVKREDCGLGQGSMNKAVYLRAFIRGLNILRAERIRAVDMTDSRNLFAFRNNGNRRNENRGLEPLGASLHVRAVASPRFPLPSISSVARHLNNYTEVKTIKSKHMRILELDLMGVYSRSEIARKIGCSEPTITNVLKSEAVQAFKRRALLGFEDEYSSLMKPAIAAVRASLNPDFADLPLRQDTAFKYLKTQGKGGENYIKHQHEHSHNHTGSVEVSQAKRKMLDKLGISLDDVIEGEFREVASVKN